MVGIIILLKLDWLGANATGDVHPFYSIILFSKQCSHSHSYKTYYDYLRGNHFSGRQFTLLLFKYFTVSVILISSSKHKRLKFHRLYNLTNAVLCEVEGNAERLGMKEGSKEDKIEVLAILTRTEIKCVREEF